MAVPDGWTELFIETSIAPADRIQYPYLQSQDLGIEGGLYLGAVPFQALSNGRYFYYLVVQNKELDVFLRRFREIDVALVGWSWEEVWLTYEHRDEAFRVDEAGIARPRQGTFGYAEIGFDPSREPPKERVLPAVDRLRRAVLQDNELSASEKGKIDGYLKAIEAIAGQPVPDVQAAVDIGERLRAFLWQVSLRVGQKEAIDMILDFINALKDMMF